MKSKDTYEIGRTHGNADSASGPDKAENVGQRTV